jgi:cytidylate kinase
MAKITIFGLAGTGTSTVGKLLASRLAYPFMSSGNMFRQKAKDLGYEFYAFEELCNRQPVYDLELDQELVKYGKENANFVLESRLGWHFIPDSIKIKITCSDDVRIKRVANRDGITFEEAERKTFDREKNAAMRYENTYNIKEMAPDSIFSLIVDSTELRPEQIVENIISALTKKVA